MPPTQAPCRGCGRFFAPRGLSQHVSKSQDPRCRSLLRTSQVVAGSSSIQHMAPPPPTLTPNNPVPFSIGGESCADRENDVEMSEGALATTRGADAS
jgi:hypothetical protein